MSSDRSSSSWIAALDLRAAPVLAVGGGRVAERRIASLLEVGARIDLVAPNTTPQIAAWAAAGRLHWHRRHWLAGDLTRRRWRLVVCAVDDAAVDAAVVRGARRHNLPVSSARGGGNVRHLAQRQVGSIRLAVDTGGQDPARARRLADACAQFLRDQGG